MIHEYEHTETKKDKLQISRFYIKNACKVKSLILPFYTLHICFVYF
jgi:hypothetical protein